ncbi:single-stranded DNA-binding protein [Rhodospirillum sp. A1_3_36]|uniref:single-stranded DNA-binding protein n=1 Tax=Rhodospirillum sp. A1_3_36 TaxID=3391666 RepID=UPI0039A5DAAD
MQNIAILAGHIGKDPETRFTQDQTRITTFTLATSRPRYASGKVLLDRDGRRVQDTEWHRITTFNGLASTVGSHCGKGMKVMVRGRIHYTKWTDDAGIDRYGCEIIAETVDFLSRAQKTEAGTDQPGEDDDIPY